MGLLAKGRQVLPPNNPPEWLTTPSPSFVFSTSASYDLTQHVTDQEGDTLIFVVGSASTALPAGVSLSSAGVLTVSSAFGASATSAILVEVNDGVNADVTSPPFTITGIASQPLGYPRIAAFLVDGFPTGDQTLSQIDDASVCDVVVMNFTESSASTPRTIPTIGLSDQQILDRIRSNNANATLIKWVNSPSDYRIASAGAYVTGVQNYIYAQTGPNGTDWWGRDVNGQLLDQGQWPGDAFLNVSDHVTANTSGEKVAAWTARRAYTYDGGRADWDGFSVDVQRTTPNSPFNLIDFDQDGDTDESVKETTGATLFKTYIAAHSSAYLALLSAPTKLTMGNNGQTWIPDRNFNSPLPEYAGMNNGGFFEGAMGRGYSPDVWGSTVNNWKYDICHMWKQYNELETYYPNIFKTLPQGRPFGAQTPFVFFNSNLGKNQPFSYARFRYALCTCLLSGNGYFNHQDNTVNDWRKWDIFDEYHKGAANTYHWLGAPIDNMVDPWVQDSTWNWPNAPTNVYAREFENGAIFVNPDFNGNRTIDPTTFKDGLWKRLDGSQDPTVNSGANITGSFTLNQADGLVVARQ